MKVLGIDLGSREVKIAMMENGKIIYKNKISTMKFYKEYSSFDGRIIVDTDKIGIEKADIFVSTGYGKNNTDLESFNPINEIKAHVYGALYQTKLKNFILIDIGGQDVKVVKVENGLLTDLELNEKCAASCGRYLENMASVLEVTLDELAEYYENPIELNSTCSVFSESELIGKIAEGNKIENLCSGVNYSLYRRIKPMINRFKSDTLVITGGVAKNKAIREYLKKDYRETAVIEEPQFNGAIGCCHYGERMMKK